MGVPGLWQVLEPAAQLCTLQSMTLQNRYSADRKSNILRIGVDISVIMNECVAADQATHMHQYKSGGALRIFFFKLCKFLRSAPVVLVFVFDGPRRPSHKRGKDINTQTVPEWVNLCKTAIESFGFYWHQAPGEAEAELAMLSHLNVIDAVLTSDNDTLVFGARCLLRSIPRSEAYELYAMDVIEDTSEYSAVGLSRGGLLIIALLSKADYSGGLQGCGLAISVALARAGFGDQLLRAFFNLQIAEALDQEIEMISGEIRAELRQNTRGFLNSRHPALASRFEAHYLSADKICAYLDPLVSTCPLNVPTWLAREPNIYAISKFCVQTLNWVPNSLEEKLGSILWPGVFLRMITSPLLTYSSSQKLCLTPKNRAKIVNIEVCSRRAKPGHWANISYSTEYFITRLAYDGQSKVSENSSMQIWVLVDYIPDVMISPQLQNHGETSNELVQPHDRSLIELLDLLEPASGSTSAQKRKHSEAFQSPEIIEISDSEEGSIEIIEISD